MQVSYWVRPFTDGRQFLLLKVLSLFGVVVLFHEVGPTSALGQGNVTITDPVPTVTFVDSDASPIPMGCPCQPLCVQNP